MTSTLIFDESGIPESLMMFDEPICLGEDESADVVMKATGASGMGLSTGTKVNYI